MIHFSLSNINFIRLNLKNRGALFAKSCLRLWGLKQNEHIESLWFCIFDDVRLWTESYLNFVSLTKLTKPTHWNTVLCNFLEIQYSASKVWYGTHNLEPKSEKKLYSICGFKKRPENSTSNYCVQIQPVRTTKTICFQICNFQIDRLTDLPIQSICFDWR